MIFFEFQSIPSLQISNGDDLFPFEEGKHYDIIALKIETSII